MADRARLLETGWEKDLRVETWEPGPVADDAVLIAVEACGVCHRDLIDRAGRFPWLQLPVTPGHEVVGTVVGIGSAVTTWRPGDRVGTLHRNSCGHCPSCLRGETSLCNQGAWVFGLIADGGYATHLFAPENALYALPHGPPGIDLCSLHCTAGTAWRGLTVQGGLQEGQRVLITGANGGVGCAAVQVASRLGADVVAVVRDEAHVAFVRASGAHSVIVDDGTSFHRKVGVPVDLALDCVGSPTFNSTLRSLRMGGRAVVVGNVREERAALNLGFVIVNGLHVSGSSGATAADMAGLLALHEASPLDLASMRDRVLPLASADFAQRRLQAGGLRGRIVLVMPPDSPGPST